MPLTTHRAGLKTCMAAPGVPLPLLALGPDPLHSVAGGSELSSNPSSATCQLGVPHRWGQ